MDVQGVHAVDFPASAITPDPSNVAKFEYAEMGEAAMEHPDWLLAEYSDNAAQIKHTDTPAHDEDSPTIDDDDENWSSEEETERDSEDIPLNMAASLTEALVRSWPGASRCCADESAVRLE